MLSVEGIYKHWTTLFLFNGRIATINWFLWLNLAIYALHQFEDSFFPEVSNKNWKSRFVDR